MEIIKDKPIPPQSRLRREELDIADKMEVGDCVLCKNRKDAYVVRQRFLRAGNNGVTRMTDEGCYIWRTE